MDPRLIGPVYCETPLAYTGFPLEPVNTVTNLVIIAFGVVAFYLLRKYASRRADLYFLAALIVINGFGSLLWHGLRTEWSLVSDFVPGILFLLAFLALWAVRLFGLVRGLLTFGAFLAATFALTALVPVVQELRGPPYQGVFAIVLYAVLMLWCTYRKYNDRGLVVLGGLGLLAAAVAFMFRTVDLLVCDVIPFGTHGLWHIFLSTGSFLSLIFLWRLGDAQEKPPA